MKRIMVFCIVSLLVACLSASLYAEALGSEVTVGVVNALSPYYLADPENDQAITPLMSSFLVEWKALTWLGAQAEIGVLGVPGAKPGEDALYWLSPQAVFRLEGGSLLPYASIGPMITWFANGNRFPLVPIKFHLGFDYPVLPWLSVGLDASTWLVLAVESVEATLELLMSSAAVGAVLRITI